MLQYSKGTSETIALPSVMLIVLILALTSLNLPTQARAQGDFTDIGAELPDAGGSSAWGDYDNDGDLDVLMTGRIGHNLISRIYRNDAGMFTNINAELIGVNGSSVSWGDYDNDGDLDALVIGGTDGTSGPDLLSCIYRNDNGTFTDIDAGLIGVLNSSVAWGDYDNDGDLDVLLTGRDMDGNNYSRIYGNNAGTFSNIHAGLTGASSSSCAWGDYDNDGDLDLVLVGFSDNGRTSRIYRNDAGTFTDIDAGLAGVWEGGIAWGDYDNDGDLDLVLTGRMGADPRSYIYRNDDGLFTNINAGLLSLYSSSVAWGDYDNDGDLDLLLTGEYYQEIEWNTVTQLYQNNNGSFTSIDTGLIDIHSGSIAWGDYDNDGDLDVLLSGIWYLEPKTRLYRNNSPLPNSHPSVPSGLEAAWAPNGSLELQWNAATDLETPPPGLTYNLRVGTTPGGMEICPPMALDSGLRKVAQIGNSNHRTSWSLNLPPGDYCWSVQALDANFAGSAFAPEQTIDGPVTDVDIPELLPEYTALHANIPNPFNPSTEIRFDLSAPQHVVLSVHGIDGRRVAELLSSSLPAGKHGVVWDGRDDGGQAVASGIYLIRLRTDSDVLTSRACLVK